jgi:hypothetical protein
MMLTINYMLAVRLAMTASGVASALAAAVATKIGADGAGIVAKVPPLRMMLHRMFNI